MLLASLSLPDHIKTLLSCQALLNACKFVRPLGWHLHNSCHVDLVATCDNECVCLALFKGRQSLMDGRKYIWSVGDVPTCHATGVAAKRVLRHSQMSRLATSTSTALSHEH